MADAAHPDPHAFGANGESLIQGLPPVVGSAGGSTWFGNGGHVAQDQIEFGVPALEGFSVLFDAQPDSGREQVVCGGADDAGRIILILNEHDIPDALSLLISAPDGATFQCRAQLSSARARRVLVAAAPGAHKAAAVYELQPWADSPGSPMSCDVRSSGTLRQVTRRGNRSTGRQGLLPRSPRILLFCGKSVSYLRCESAPALMAASMALIWTWQKFGPGTPIPKPVYPLTV